MKSEIITRRDAAIHTVKRVSIAVSATILLSSAMIVIEFGTDFNANVSVHTVLTRGIVIGTVIAAVLTAVLTHRSSMLMIELNKTKAELLKISRTDQLTGLLNRRGYLEAATEMLAQAITANRSAVALMCDIDRFKAINDRYGHDFGDQLLAEVGEAMRAFGDENNVLVARHGGEEFAALLIDVTTEQAIQHANALRQLCAATTILNDQGASANVTISIGLAARDQKQSLSAMMRAADGALYLAKRMGRDRVVRAEVPSVA